MKVIQSWASICRLSAVLIAGGVLAAQETKPLPVPDSTGKPIQNSLQPSPHDVPKSGNIEVLTDTQGVDFGPYLQAALSKVRRNWYASIPEGAEQKKGVVAIEFAIQKDGSLTGMKVRFSSGDEALDGAAWTGVTESSPFLPLPEAFKGPNLALRFRFYYNPDKSEGNAERSNPASDPTPAPPLVHVQAALPGSTQMVAERQAAASVLCSSPKPTTTHVEGNITSEASDTVLQQYLDTNVLPLIRANWYRLISRSGEKVAGDASVEFDVLKDGTIVSVKLVDGAGHAALSELAINAVKNSAPLPPVPSEFSGGSFVVRSHFFYQPDPNGVASSRGRVAAVNGDSPAFARYCTPDELSKGAVDCMVPPKPTYQTEPEFSPEARQQKKEGVVTVRIVVAHDGTVQSACVDRALGYGLDEEAVNAIRSWKFTPATFNGQPLATLLLIEVDFHHSDKPEGTTPDAMKAALVSAPAAPAPEAAPSDGKPAAANSAAQASTKITTIAIGKGVTPPRLIYSPAPESAEGSGSTKCSGTVTLQLVVSTEGKAENIKVLKGLGPQLDQKAIDALQQWKFEPAMKDGQRVAVEIAVEVDFHLY
jgi:TonB family protein